MGRRPGGERVLGPYRNGKGWVVVHVDGNGDRASQSAATEADAQAIAEALKRDIAGVSAVTIEQALTDYESYLKIDRGIKALTQAQYLYRLRTFFDDTGRLLRSLTPTVIAKLYRALLEGKRQRGVGSFSVDTHRDILASVKTFLRWAVKTKRIPASPAETVEGIGRRRKGKEQLRVEEARKWVGVAFSLAAKGDAGAIAALLTLYLGCRAGEIVARTVRDVDDGGRLLWIPHAKTQAGKRKLEVPEPIRPFLVALAADRLPGELLFGVHWRDWPRHQVHRICDLAKVPRVGAHAMRGLHASLAAESGIAGHVIAQAMGHTSSAVTFAHYATTESVAKGKRDRVLEVLQGGKK